jgi:hypothetical protein
MLNDHRGEVITDHDEQQKRMTFLRIIYDYYIYLFEQQQERAKNLNNAVKVYVTFLSLILGALTYKLLYDSNIFDRISKSSLSEITHACPLKPQLIDIAGV